MTSYLSVSTALTRRFFEALPHGAPPASPQEVRFKSENLHNVVKWIPGPGTPNGTWYTVQYLIYGDTEEDAPGLEVWREVQGCKRRFQTSCDLSNETSDQEENYFARVRAVSRDGTSEWNYTDRFSPLLDTTFGPPTANIVVRERRMFVNLTGPMRWSGKNDKREDPMATYYPEMLYNLSVYNNKTKNTLSYLVHEAVEIPLQDFNTLYCVSARVYFKSLLLKTKASPRKCLTTEKDPNKHQVLMLILGGILPLMIILLLLVLVGVPVYHYVFCIKQRHPPNLVVAHLPEYQQKFPPDMPLTLNFIYYVNNATAESDPGDRVKTKGPYKTSLASVHQSEVEALLATPCSAYAAQHVSQGDPEAQTVTQQSVHFAEVTQSESSDYGFVLKTHAVEKEAEVSCPHLLCDGVPGGSTVGAPSGYKQQWQASSPDFQEEPENDGGTIVNWDPETGRIQLSLPLDLEPEPDLVEVESPECDELHPFDVFSEIYIRRSLGGSTEFEDDLTKMENSWALQVNMEK